MTAKYDYVKACARLAVRRYPIGDDFRKVLRKLVRDALTHADCGIPDDIANRIARELVPGKRWAK